MEAEAKNENAEPEELEFLPELESAEDESQGSFSESSVQKQTSRRLPILLRLCRRSTIFLSLTLIATIIFFITGNRQTFLDSNLNLILQIISCNAIALTFFSAASALECIFYLIKDRKLRLFFHLFVYILVLVVSISTSLFSMSINLLSEGFAF